LLFRKKGLSSSTELRKISWVKLKIAGWISIGAMAGAPPRCNCRQWLCRHLLPLEELQQLAAVFGMVKTVCGWTKKLITDAISGMVASLDPHSV
jgi:carboxyl-terminal processing protease